MNSTALRVRFSLRLLIAEFVAAGWLLACSAGCPRDNVRPGMPNSKRVGAVGSQRLVGSPDGFSIAWMEPEIDGLASGQLVKYDILTKETMRIHNVAGFSFVSTGELAVVQPDSAGRRTLGILRRGDGAPHVIGPVDRWWCAPGGFGASQTETRISVWGADGIMIPTPLRAPVEVIVPTSPGPIRLVLRDSDGRIFALNDKGQLKRLAAGGTAVALARRGNAVAVGDCDGIKGQVCVWRAGALEPKRIRWDDPRQLEFDSAGAHLVVGSGPSEDRAIAIMDGQSGPVLLDRHVESVVWAKASPVLLWLSRPALSEHAEIKAWTPWRGVTPVSSGDVDGCIANLAVAPDGRAWACLEVAAAQRIGSVRVGPTDGTARVSLVGNSVVDYGFSPTGDVLWMRQRCGRGESGCEIVTVPVADGAVSGGVTRLTGIGKQLRFDSERASRVLFESDLHGWETVLKNGRYHERLGEVSLQDAVLLRENYVAVLRHGSQGGVFLMKEKTPANEHGG